MPQWRQPSKTEDGLFWYWINERHRIYLSRQSGEPWPWTDDEVLRRYKFTNVFRELDRTTIDLHKRIDHLKMSAANKLYRILLFRAFNWPPTYDLVIKAGGRSNDFTKIRHALHARKRKKVKIFTGAYIITNAGNKRPKIDMMLDALMEMFKHRVSTWAAIKHSNSMRGTTQIISQFPMMGKFTGYEVACDLRWQEGMLDNASDVMTWANPGPGARRGINRLLSGQHHPNVLRGEQEHVDYMVELLVRSSVCLEEHVPPLEMREIEHSLCEFDKMRRVQLGQGRPRGIYKWRGALL